MSLYQTIESDMRAALKGGDTLKLSVLRMLMSAVKTLAIEKNLKNVEDVEVIQIAQRQVKQHKEAIEQFEKGLRNDLADKEKAELKILESYLPKQMDASELEAVVRETIVSLGAVTKTEAGKVMKAVMEKVRGRADGKSVNKLVSDLLK